MAKTIQLKATPRTGSGTIASKALRKSGTAPGHNRRPQISHQFQVIRQVVQGIQARTQNFVLLIEMMQIRPRIVLAGRAGAFRIEWCLRSAVALITDFDNTPGCKQIAITGVTGWHHAVKHVHATTYRRDEIGRGTHPHQVAGLVL